MHKDDQELCDNSESWETIKAVLERQYKDNAERHGLPKTPRDDRAFYACLSGYYESRITSLIRYIAESCDN